MGAGPWLNKVCQEDSLENTHALEDFVDQDEPCKRESVFSIWKWIKQLKHCIWVVPYSVFATQAVTPTR